MDIFFIYVWYSSLIHYYYYADDDLIFMITRYCCLLQHMFDTHEKSYFNTIRILWCHINQLFFLFFLPTIFILYTNFLLLFVFALLLIWSCYLMMSEMIGNVYFILVTFLRAWTNISREKKNENKFCHFDCHLNRYWWKIKIPYIGIYGISQE